MSKGSAEGSAEPKSTKKTENEKAMLAPAPSLPKEEPRKQLEAAREMALDELETLKRDLEQERAKSKEHLDRLKYLQADFENSLKRIRRDAEEAVRFGSEQLILKLIDVAENLERAVEAGEKIGEKSELATGVKMICRQLDQILGQEGLERIPAEGEQFNPAMHEALAQIESNDETEGTVLKEIRRGYVLKGKVLRPSKVEVAKRPAKNQLEQSGCVG